MEIIATAPTAKGFGIAVISLTAHSTGATYFEVVRTHRNKYATLSRHTSEAAARKAANAEYRADRKAA